MRKQKKKSIWTYSDPALERLSVTFLEGLLDVAKIDLASRNYNSYQRAIFRSDTVHTGVKSLSEEADLRLYAFHCNK